MKNNRPLVTPVTILRGLLWSAGQMDTVSQCHLERYKTTEHTSQGRGSLVPLTLSSAALVAGVRNSVVYLREEGKSNPARCSPNHDQSCHEDKMESKSKS